MAWIALLQTLEYGNNFTVPSDHKKLFFLCSFLVFQWKCIKSLKSRYIYLTTKITLNKKPYFMRNWWNEVILWLNQEQISANKLMNSISSNRKQDDFWPQWQKFASYFTHELT